MKEINLLVELWMYGNCLWFFWTTDTSSQPFTEAGTCKSELPSGTEHTQRGSNTMFPLSIIQAHLKQKQSSFWGLLLTATEKLPSTTAIFNMQFFSIPYKNCNRKLSLWTPKGCRCQDSPNKYLKKRKWKTEHWFSTYISSTWVSSHPVNVMTFLWPVSFRLAS